MKKAFTLAEIMVVLTVIGVLTAILLPIVANSTPDKNVMKFKKANATFAKVISEMANSGEYFKEGDLGVLKNGDLVANSKRGAICETFADIVSAKRKVCDYTTDSFSGGSNGGVITSCGYGGESTCSVSRNGYSNPSWEGIAIELDKRCKNAVKNYAEKDIGVLTVDGVYYYESNLTNPFGCTLSSAQTDCDYFPPEYKNKGVSWWENQRMYNHLYTDIVDWDTGIQAPRYYKQFCIDIDGINEGEDPFGYGVRVDGKIILGKRATDWLEKDFQGKDPSEQE